MVNINSIDELEDLGIGCNIDKLEKLAVEAYYCELLGMRINDKQSRIIEILREIKPNSEVFTGGVVLKDEAIEKYEKLSDIDRIDCGDVLYGCYGDTFKVIEERVKEGSCAVSAVELNNGVCVRMEYRFGELRAVLTCMGNIEISRSLVGTIPQDVEQWKGIKNVEVRAIVCGNNVAYKVATGRVNANEERVVCYDVVNDAGGKAKMTNWDKLRYLRAVGFKCCDSMMIKDVDEDNLEDAITAVMDKFKNGDDCPQAIIELVINGEVYNDYIVDMKNSRSKMFATTITGIRFENSNEYIKPIISVAKINTGDQVISEIKLSSFREMYEAGCRVGGRVRVSIGKDIKVHNINEAI